MSARAITGAGLSLAALLLVAGAAFGEQRRPYGGVAPGVPATTPPPAPRGAWTHLTWLGFVPEEDGTARVFAQLGGEREVEQAIVGDELWILLDRVRPSSRNVMRPLDVRFFSTDLAGVRAERTTRRRARDGEPALPSGIKIVVTFAGDTEPRKADVSVVREDDDYHYLYLDFPKPGGAAGD